jgi:uncharacterized coiled-coil protein SlyX
MVTAFWETIERQQIHIDALHDRIRALEAA